MSHLDIAAAATQDHSGTSFVVGGLRPSLVIRQTSLSHDAGDRVEGVAFAQFAALADTHGDEEPGQTLRATSLDAVSRNLLQLDSREWSPRVAKQLSDAVQPAAEAVCVGNASATLSGLTAALLQWPHVAVSMVGYGVTLVATTSSAREVLGRLSRDESGGFAEHEAGSWHGELSRQDVLIIGNVEFARDWSEKRLVEFLSPHIDKSAEDLAASLVGGTFAGNGRAASVLVAKLDEGDVPVEAVAASTGVLTASDANTGAATSSPLGSVQA